MHIGSTRAAAILKVLCWPISYCLGSDAKDRYYAALDEWETSGEHGEQRDVAAWRLRDACYRETDHVNLSGLGLKTWPPLPTLRMVDISDNALTDVPKRWRESMEKVVARNNNISVLPDMPLGMRHIDFSGNSIWKTGDLTGIEYIDLHDNCLTTVPALSSGLLQVDLSYNDIPDVWDDQIPDGCKIFLSGEALKNLQMRRTLPRYPELSRESREKWCEIFRGGEGKNARQFFAFLEEFRKAFKLEAKEMRPGLTIWLERLANCEMLRKKIFGQAIDGLETCKNGKLQTFNRMESAFSGNDAGQEPDDRASWFPNGEFLKNVMVRRTLREYSGLGPAVREKWCQIFHGGEKKNADRFFEFVEQVRTALKIENKEIHAGLITWLERMAGCDALRKEIFAMAGDGLGTCKVGTLLALEDIENALVRDGVGEEARGIARLGFLNGEGLENVAIRRTLPEYRKLSRKAREKWCEVLLGDQRQNAEQFSSVFLGRLREVLRMDSREFHEGATIWLERLAGGNSDALREETFARAISALGHCKDRVLAEFKQMESALITDDIKHGEYDETIPELIAMARQIFRRKELQDFSAKLASEMGHEEDLEVELDLNLGLGRRLALNTQVQAMYHGYITKLKKHHFDDAEKSVKNKENKNFLIWLMHWPVWEALVARLSPDLFAEAEAERQIRIASWLDKANKECAAGLKKEIDVINGAKEIAAQATEDARMKITERFAAKRGCTDELKRLWDMNTLRPVRPPIKTRPPLLHMLGTRFQNKKAHRN